MLEQEIASLIRYILMKAGNPSPYYNEIPETFVVPSVYFPVPDITSQGDTLSTYALCYTWFIKFFHSETPLAYGLGLTVLAALQSGRNLIPLIDQDGGYAGRGFRIKDPSLKKIDGASGVAQLELSWNSPRPYDDPEVQKMMVYDLNIYRRGAYEAAVRQIGGL